jgi:lactate dehydrogenase-like 2-hydroxyacid dehydrogenase
MADPASPRRWRVLIADAEYAQSIKDVAPRFPELELVCADPTQDARALAGPGFDGLIAQEAAVDAALLGALPGLRVALKLGRSYFNFDAAAVRARGLTFAACPRKGPNCVAELAITFVLALSKDLLMSHRAVAEGAYRLRGLRPIRTEQRKMAFHWMRHMTVHEVVGKTLGIVGMGEIGVELALRANALGMRCLYHKRSRLSPELEARFSAEYRDLPALLRESDYVCLAVPHTPETERMFGPEQFAQMKPEAYLVNICRGGVVDEEALIQALAEQRIAGAGLDVFTFEPLPFDSPLCRMHNVILTPHIGGGTGTNRPLELGEALEEMRRILNGERPRVPLN